MVGQTAVLLEVGGHDEVAAWYAELVRQRADGRITAVDIVPAARTVLIDGVPDPYKMLESLEKAHEPARPGRAGRDGPPPGAPDGKQAARAQIAPAPGDLTFGSGRLLGGWPSRSR